MNSLNFDLAFIGGFLVYFLLKMSQFTRRKKKLGDIVMQTPGGIKNSDSLLQIIVFIILAVIIVVAYIGNVLNNQGLLVLLVFMGLFFGFMAFTVYMAFTPKGLYEKGIVTISGVIPYSQIKEYSIRHRRKNKGLILDIQKVGSTAFSGNDFVYIEKNQKTEVNQILKKKIKKKKKKR